LRAVKLLGSDASSPEQQRCGREVIDRQAHRMALLLDDLLDVSRITCGRLELKIERVNLSTLIHSAIETVRPTGVGSQAGPLPCLTAHLQPPI
jgi:signal transduction histidine kinase